MNVSESIYCRFCAEQKSVQQVIDFSKTTSIRNDIADKLSFIDIQWFDLSAEHLPETICNLCYRSLTMAYEFFMKIKTSQSVLINLLNDNLKQDSSIHEGSTTYMKKESCNEYSPNDIQVSIVEETAWNSYPWICRECGTTYDSMSQLRDHSKETHEKCNNFQCADCDAVFKDFSAFIEHVRGHRENLINFCQYCNVKVEPETDHISIHTSQPHCLSCGELFRLKTSLQRHIYTYQSVNKKKKPVAENQVSNDIEFVDEDINIESWSDYPWVCQYCDLRLQDQNSLRRHRKDVHKKCSGMRCFDCFEDGCESFFDYNWFFEHVTRIHRPNLKSYCQYCNQKFHGDVDNIVHITLHHSGPQCNVCGESFQNHNELQNHIKDNNYPPKSEKTPYKRREGPVSKEDLTCHVCTKELKNLNSFRSHMKLHENRSRNFFCDVCGKSFILEHHLRAHTEIHNKSDPEICKICNKSFANLTRLKAHIRTHDNKKPFECDHCHKCFRLKGQLKDHMIIHMDLFPYSCQLCEKKFKFKTVLSNHIVYHSGARPYACSDCNRDFTSWSNCNKHMKRKHGTTLVKSKNTEPSNAIDEEIEKWTEQVMKRKRLKPMKRTAAAHMMEQRAQIVALHERGLNISEISRELNVSRNTARTWIKRYSEDGSLEDRLAVDSAST